MSDDEFNPDITPYDLAERLVAGREVTETGKREIAAELMTVHQLSIAMVTRINNSDCDTEHLIEFVESLVKRAGFDPRDL